MKTKMKTFIFALELPRNQQGLEDYMRVFVVGYYLYKMYQITWTHNDCNWLNRTQATSYYFVAF